MLLTAKKKDSAFSLQEAILMPTLILQMLYY